MPDPITRIEKVDISIFSKNHDFDFNSRRGFEALKLSIKNVGILYPIITIPDTNNHLIIDGFKRVEIAGKLGIHTIPVITLPLSLDKEEIIKIRYNNLNIKEEDLNILQKVSIYHLLKLHHSELKSIQDWIEQLNLPKNKVLLNKLCQILAWPDKAKNVIHQYSLSYKNIRFLIDQNIDVIESLFELAHSLSLRFVELNNIFNLLLEISLNNNQTILEVLRIPEVNNILADFTLNRNQKIVAFKTKLQQMRFPLIAKYQDEINQKMKKLSFSNNVIFAYDKYFERPELTIKIKIKDVDSFDNLIDEMQNSKNVKLIHEMILLL